MRGPAVPLERWFLRVMLGVSVVAWLALLLAELGQFRLWPYWDSCSRPGRSGSAC